MAASIITASSPPPLNLATGAASHLSSLATPSSSSAASAPALKNQSQYQSPASGGITVTTDISSHTSSSKTTPKPQWKRAPPPHLGGLVYSRSSRSGGFVKPREGPRVFSPYNVSEFHYSDSGHWWEYHHSRQCSLVHDLDKESVRSASTGGQQGTRRHASGSTLQGLFRSHSEPQSRADELSNSKVKAEGHRMAKKGKLAPSFVRTKTRSGTKHAHIVIDGMSETRMPRTECVVLDSSGPPKVEMVDYGKASRDEVVERQASVSTFEVNKVGNPEKPTFLINGSREPHSGSEQPPGQPTMSGAIKSLQPETHKGSRESWLSWRPKKKLVETDSTSESLPQLTESGFLHIDLGKWNRDEQTPSRDMGSPEKGPPPERMPVNNSRSQPSIRDFARTIDEIKDQEHSQGAQIPAETQSNAAKDRYQTNSYNPRRELNNKRPLDSEYLVLDLEKQNATPNPSKMTSRLALQAKEPFDIGAPTVKHVLSPSVSTVASTATGEAHSDASLHEAMSAKAIPIRQGTVRRPRKRDSKSQVSPGSPPNGPLPSIPCGGKARLYDYHQYAGPPQTYSSPACTAVALHISPEESQCLIKDETITRTPRNSQSRRCSGSSQRLATNNQYSSSRNDKLSDDVPLQPEHDIGVSRHGTPGQPAVHIKIKSRDFGIVSFPTPPSPSRSSPSRSSKDRRRGMIPPSRRLIEDIEPVELIELSGETAGARKERSGARGCGQEGAMLGRPNQFSPKARETEVNKKIMPYSQANGGHILDGASLYQPLPSPAPSQAEHPTSAMISEYSKRQFDGQGILEPPQDLYERDSGTSSQAPIFVVATQSPTAPIRRSTSQKKSRNYRASPDSKSVTASAQGYGNAHSGGLAAFGDPDRARSASSYSMLTKFGYDTGPDGGPTPTIPDLFQPPLNRTSRGASSTMLNMEVRLARMEQKVAEMEGPLKVFMAGAEMYMNLTGSERGSRQVSGASFDARDNGYQNSNSTRDLNGRCDLAQPHSSQSHRRTPYSGMDGLHHVAGGSGLEQVQSKLDQPFNGNSSGACFM